MNMMPSGAAIAGAIFLMVLFVASLAGTVFFVVNGMIPGIMPCAAMAAITAYFIVLNDWPRVWKPFLAR